MAEREYTFEEIDKQIQQADLDGFERGAREVTAEAVAAQPANVLPRICEVYRVVRPILVALSNFPLIPERWRRALKVFISWMDRLCPGG